MSTRTFEEFFKAVYVRVGFVSSKDELREAWDASRAALLAESPEVGKLIRLLQMNYSYFVIQETSAVSAIELFRDAADALLFQQARIKALEEENAGIKGELESANRAYANVMQAVDEYGSYKP